MSSKVDILRPETWVKYRPALCRACTAGCCTLPVTVTSEDLFHMGFIDAHEVSGKLLKVANRLMKQGIVRSFNSRTKIFTLQTKDGGALGTPYDCLFLDSERLCTIYDRRPSVCRRFPLNSARPGFCPSEKKSRGKG